jgi:hypothetical protein
MKRWLLGILAALTLCSIAHAQSGVTVVTAVVKDPSGNLYVGCRGNADFVPSPTATQIPTIFGSTFQTSVVINSCDSFAAFTLTLADNLVVSDGHTGGVGSMWRISICSSNTPPVCFNLVLQITGATQNITAALQAASAPLPGTLFGILTAGTFISAAANPSASGTIRLATADSLAFRNFANGGDMFLSTSQGTVGTRPSDLASFLNFNGLAAAMFQSLSSQTSAASGLFRMQSGESACWRNNANNADGCLSRNSSDILTWPTGFKVGTSSVFSSLPACAAGIEGTLMPVSDSTTNVLGATITGTGANHVLAYCDGTNWTVASK